MMDGTVGPSAAIKPGESFTYDFIAGPAGLYPYHCHVEPIVDHINRGLYGAMIIDPVEGRPPAHEMVMLMNAYDLDINAGMKPTFSVPDFKQAQQILRIANDTLSATDTDGAGGGGEEEPTQTSEGDNNNNNDEESTSSSTNDQGRPTQASLEAEREDIELDMERDNEIYTVNGKAFEYATYPIELKEDELVRIYLLNMVEFDPVNNFHLHSDMFYYTPGGTIDTPAIHTDVVSLSQGDRGIIEFKPTSQGMMMFHSHINEFSLLGWMGFFNVVDKDGAQ
jgi:FtsP/CotA-like multicopper oxidase with cupredoxin domain